jgi:hypothetical protein
MLEQDGVVEVAMSGIERAISVRIRVSRLTNTIGSYL